MNHVEIKSYSDEYKDQVINLILNIQNNEYNMPISIIDQPDLLDVQNFYQIGSGGFWVAVNENKQVIGTIAIIDIGNKQVALRKMFVEKNNRGKSLSVAKKLLDILFSHCYQNNVNQIYLGTTPFFLAAHKFYENNGFRQIPKEHLPQQFPIMPLDTRFYVYECK